MGNAASVLSSQNTHDKVASRFKDACKWQESKPNACKEEIIEYLKCQIKELDEDDDFKGCNFKENNIRDASTTRNYVSNNHPSNKGNTPLDTAKEDHIVNRHKETFMDSIYIKNWLCNQEADQLFNHLYEKGAEMKKKMDSMIATNPDVKYPLSTITYGFKREIDDALALDRWGSYHEGWCRTLEPTDEIVKLSQKAREYFNLPDYALNSVVVNYYWDGKHTHIPAHRDTTACLEPNSRIHCLSLGATRDFILCDNADSGEYMKDKMHIFREWKVRHGDMYAVGAQTNLSYCHAVPHDDTVQDLRISIILRTVTKSFIQLNNVPSRSVQMADGTQKVLKAVCILTDDIHQLGESTHIAELVEKREKIKLEKRLNLLNQTNLTAAPSSSSDNKEKDNKDKETFELKKSLSSSKGDVVVSTQIKGSSSENDILPTATATAMTTLMVPKTIDLEDPKKYFMGVGMEVPQ